MYCCWGDKGAVGCRTMISLGGIGMEKNEMLPLLQTCMFSFAVDMLMGQPWQQQQQLAQQRGGSRSNCMSYTLRWHLSVNKRLSNNSTPVLTAVCACLFTTAPHPGPAWHWGQAQIWSTCSADLGPSSVSCCACVLRCAVLCCYRLLMTAGSAPCRPAATCQLASLARESTVVLCLP